MLNVNERICNICNMNETKEEIHFLLWCTCYNDLRHLFTRKATETRGDILSLTQSQKMDCLMESHYVGIAKHIIAAMNKRKLNLYNLKSVSFNHIQTCL